LEKKKKEKKKETINPVLYIGEEKRKTPDPLAKKKKK